MKCKRNKEGWKTKGWFQQNSNRIYNRYSQNFTFLPFVCFYNRGISWKCQPQSSNQSYFMVAQPIKCHCCPHIESSQSICTANQLTGFYKRATLVLKVLNGLTF